MLTKGSRRFFLPGMECLFSILAPVPESTPMKSVDGSGVRTFVLQCFQQQGRSKVVHPEIFGKQQLIVDIIARTYRYQ
ncbi:MAG: hypothetical protein H0V30_13460 [Chitinophagaceae bacterium]|jgi:hypothetical protein|nr:hypothetical protein [Chitinophagaceae bacterium]